MKKLIRTLTRAAAVVAAGIVTATPIAAPISDGLRFLL